MNLTLDDFDDFHLAVHHRPPFDWQKRLLRQIVEKRTWPRVLDLPTGSGKTTCIDIALFALALDASTPAAKRWCPRRIAMIVDRRVVVDQAAERGRKLLHALTTSTVPQVVAVRQALALLAGPDEEPLGVFTLRGGIPKDDGWTRTPDQPLIIASTVDQIGSRLLIQGYGVSPGMRPVHAGLAGNDMLILLDEVHLSQPFKQTLEWLHVLRERFSGNELPRRFQFAFLSATPGATEAEPFCLTPEELAPDSKLGPRLHAKKPVRIVDVSGREELAAKVTNETEELLKQHAVVAAVVNRVDTALRVFALLKKKLGEDTDVVLLTGRMRPLDRDDVLATYRSRIATGMRRRGADEARLIVVGTQCIEAGADFDFDAMVTESASFDALRQRFGRVDRLGEYKDEKGNGKAEGVIVHDEAAEIKKRDKSGKIVWKEGKVDMVKGDPVYGDTILKTVKWLKSDPDNTAKGKKNKKSKATPVADGLFRPIDFGSRSLLNAPAELLSPKENAPTLLPAYLDLWSQTAPEPYAVPDPSLFLHGPRSGPEDVQVVWRADINENLHGSSALPNAVAAVSAVRPSSLEAISLPFVATLRWLANRKHVFEGCADLEIKSDDQEEKTGGRLVLRWRGDESEIVDASGIRPRDTIVVPSSYGGINPASKCFDPLATQEVPDVAERASLLGRGVPILRLHQRVLAGLDLNLNHEDPKSARAHLVALAKDLTGWRRPWALWVGKGRKTGSVPAGNGENNGWRILSGKRVKPYVLRNEMATGGQYAEASLEAGISATTEGEDSSYTGSDVTLKAHCQHVEQFVRDYAIRLGLPDKLANDLALAAWLHDIGKADRRFQRMLRGGSEIALYRDEERLLAKSGMISGSKTEHRRAQRLSGYPSGMRHEVQSLALIESVLDEIKVKAHDIELVMHLVASHHGHCRPFAPAIEDIAPVNVILDDHESNTFGATTFGPTSSAHELYRLDSPLADRFWSLVGKYGWLELCWLETIIRLADHRASEDEEGSEG
jgi:CRISPR-associated endonuclease/helicase Cas3